MTVNPYFNENKAQSEQNLVEDLIIESIQIKGNNFYYIPRETISLDQMLNEDPNSNFTKYRQIEMYVPNPTSYIEDSFLLGDMGGHMSRSIEYIVSKKRFLQEIGDFSPKSGDLIYSKYNNSVWEITFVNYEKSPIYQLNKMYIFSIMARPFVYSHETFETGIDEIDDVLNDLVNPLAKNDVFEDEAVESLDFDPDDPFAEKILEDY